MFEKVNPSHPDKVADRIAGAITDLAYKKQDSPKIAVEVLLGHGVCYVIIETSVLFLETEIDKIVKRIAGDVKLELKIVPQDYHLSKNQDEIIKCGDNGIFKGMPITDEQYELAKIAQDIYKKYPFDGKYILDDKRLVICQSNADSSYLKKKYPAADINPLGDWTGGTDVDSGATNRKLGSDMGDAVTGGGMCLSGDTEFIGEDYKWHPISKYNNYKGKIGQWNNGNLEFVYPCKYICNESDWFYEFKIGKKLQMKVTLNHDVIIEKENKEYEKIRASHLTYLLNNMGIKAWIPQYFKFTPSSLKSEYATESDYRLQVAFCADGTITYPYCKKWTGRIKVKKQYKIERLRKLLSGKIYKETKDKYGYSIFWFNPTKLCRSLYECFKNENWDILFDEIYKWDGTESEKIFRTTNKQDADFIQFVLSTHGAVNSLLTGHGCLTSTEYRVRELQGNKTYLYKPKIATLDYKMCSSPEPSYCFTVPSHNLLVRYKDKIFVTGNCGKDLSKADVSLNIYAHIQAQKTGQPYLLSCAIGDTEVAGIKYEEIVNIAHAYINRLGGFEKFAEWGLIR